MRKVCFGLCGALMVAALSLSAAGEIKSVDDVLVLQGDEFYEAAWETQFGSLGQTLTVTERFKILDRMIQDKAIEQEKHWTGFTGFVEDLSRRLETKDELLTLALKLEPVAPKSDYQRGLLANALLDARWRLLLAEWQKNPPLPLSAPPWNGPPDERLEKYPAEFQRDWELYESLSLPFRKLTKAAVVQQSNGVAFLANEKKFWQLITDLATDKDGVTTEEILRYEWGSWCGTGSEQFTASKSMALTVLLLREKKLPEAVGALLVKERGRRHGDEERDCVLRADFLKLLADGWDWSQLAFGGLLGSEIGKLEWENEQQREFWLWMLQANGGGREARKLLELSRSATAERLADYVPALAAFVEAEGNIHMGFYVKSGLVDKATQDEIARFIYSKADADGAPALSKALLFAMQKMRRADAKEALRRLVNHPSPKVADGAAKLLREMGETVAVPKKLGPVRYRLTVSGQPYANRKLYWTITNDPGKRRHAPAGMGGSYALEGWVESNDWTDTDTDGVLTFSRDIWLSLKDSALKMYVSCNYLKDTDDPLFALEVPLPADSDEIQEVSVSVKPFELRLALPRELAEYAGRSMNIHLGSKSDARKPIVSGAVTLPVAEHVRFAALQSGEYVLTVSVPGAKLWRGDINTADADSQTVTLAKATELRFKLKPPAGWPSGAGFYPRVFLFKDGEHFRYDGSDASAKGWLFRGLMPGKYQLKFFSSNELVKKGGENYEKFPFAAKVVEFEIPADQPLELDLGEIKF